MFSITEFSKIKLTLSASHIKYNVTEQYALIMVRNVWLDFIRSFFNWQLFQRAFKAPGISSVANVRNVHDFEMKNCDLKED